MIRYVFVLVLLACSAFADMPIVPITGNDAFNYFGSLFIWLIIGAMPFIIAFSFLAGLKDKF